MRVEGESVEVNDRVFEDGVVGGVESMELLREGKVVVWELRERESRVLNCRESDVGGVGVIEEMGDWEKREVVGRLEGGVGVLVVWEVEREGFGVLFGVRIGDVLCEFVLSVVGFVESRGRDSVIGEDGMVGRKRERRLREVGEEMKEGGGMLRGKEVIVNRVEGGEVVVKNGV